MAAPRGSGIERARASTSRPADRPRDRAFIVVKFGAMRSIDGVFLGYDGRPARSTAVSQFQATLSSYGIPSTVRQRRGIDIAAGCGQLRAAQPHPDVHETITA